MIDSSHSLASKKKKARYIFFLFSSSPSPSYSDLFTREIHFPLSSSNDRWKARYLSVRSSFYKFRDMLVNEEAPDIVNLPSEASEKKKKKREKLVRENDPFEERGIRLTNIPTGEMYFSREKG